MYPSPDDMKAAPLWENYIVAQVVQACLGRIPHGARAIGVQVEGALARVVAQLPQEGSSYAEDLADLRDICDTLEDLVGSDVTVQSEIIFVDRRPRDGIRWVFVARPDAIGADDD